MKAVKSFTVFLVVLYVAVLLLPSSVSAGISAKERFRLIGAQVESDNLTGSALYSKLCETEGNIVISPYSIGMAMTMATAGASGGTRDEMAKVMHQSLPEGEMDKAAGLLHHTINNISAKEVVLETANGLCLTLHGTIVSPDYKKLIKDTYYAELFTADNVGPINSWVDRKTHGKIKKILESFSPNSVCVLLNAVYFKGDWAAKFDKKQTYDDYFHTEDGGKIKVKMMKQSSDFQLLKEKDYQVLSMPFNGKKIRFLALLPNKGVKLSELEKKLTGKEIVDIVRKVKCSRPGKVLAMIPRFKVSYKASLIDSFKSLGMQKPFSFKESDFGRLLGKKDAVGVVRISQIQHKAYLEINEEGGKAAAATAVGIELKCAMPSPSRPSVFKADRPFLFFITDIITNSILFMGRYSQP